MQPDLFARSGFYVSAIDGKRRAIMRGPFATHGEALALVTPTARRADDLQPGAWFWAWGTCKLTTDKTLQSGVMNKYFSA